MGLDLTATYAAMYNRVAVDADGSAVRALVGSVFLARDLTNLAGKTLPYLVWRPLGGDGQSGEMTNTSAGWYAYVAPNGGDSTLTTIASAVYALYSIPFGVASGRLVCLAPRAPFFDEALTLRGIYIPFYYRRLG